MASLLRQWWLHQVESSNTNPYSHAKLHVSQWPSYFQVLIEYSIPGKGSNGISILRSPQTNIFGKRGLYYRDLLLWCDPTKWPYIMELAATEYLIGGSTVTCILAMVPWLLAVYSLYFSVACSVERSMRHKHLSHCFSLSAEIAKCMGQSLHFNTYGGNPLACAVGSAVLDVSCRASIL